MKFWVFITFLFIFYRCTNDDKILPENNSPEVDYTTFDDDTFFVDSTYTFKPKIIPWNWEENAIPLQIEKTTVEPLNTVQPLNPINTGAVKYKLVQDYSKTILENVRPDTILIDNPKITYLKTPILNTTEKLTYFSLTTYENLPENEVLTFEEDDHGNIWLGHLNGFSIITGNKLRYYGKNQGLDIVRVNDILFQDSLVWFTSNSGLFCFDGRHLIRYNGMTGFPSDNMESLCLGSKNEIWISTLTSGIIRRKENQFINYQFTSEDGFNPIRVLESKGDEICISTDEGPMLFRDEAFYKFRHNDDRLIYSYEIHVQDDNSWWIGTFTGELLHILNDTLYDYTEQLDFKIGFISDITHSEEKVFITTYRNGVLILDRKTKSLRKWKGEGFEPFISLDAVRQTENGLLFSSYSKGLLYTLIENFEIYNEAELSIKGGLRSIQKMKGRGIFINSFADGVVVMPREDSIFKIKFIAKNIPYLNGINNSIPYKDGYLLTTSAGLIYTDFITARLYKNEDAFIGNRLESIYEDQKGRIWIGTNNSGFFCINQNQIQLYERQEGFPVANPQNFVEDKEGNLWIGTYSHGPLLLKDDSFSFTRAKNNDGSYLLKAMDIDEDGIIWSLTADEIQLFHADTLKHLTSNEGIIGGTLKFLKIVNNQVVICSTKGFSFIKKSSGYASNIKIGNNYYAIQNYYREDGLPALFSTGQDFYIDEENNFWWSGQNDLYRLNLNKSYHIKSVPTPSIVAIDFLDSINVNNDVSYTKLMNYTDVPENLLLKHTHNNLKITLATTDFEEAHRIQYRYRLLPIEKKWSVIGSDGIIELRNLEWNDYTLEFEACQENGDWSKTKFYKFSIVTPWYATFLMYLVYCISLVFIVYSIIKLRTRKLQKQKELLKHKVEVATRELQEKHNEIQDSINYAQRIQQAILPEEEEIKRFLPEHFIVYQPKDVIAGDFYWVRALEDENQILFAAADCTGHGVPGAMVSVVCHNALNQSLNEFGCKKPNEILDQTRRLVIEAFKSKAFEVNDGMDIALCLYNKQKNTLEFSGANNSLYILRNSEIIEVKPDKQPIGKYANPIPFTLKEINLFKGDMIYLFSDGYADQFGGEKGKKLKYKNFKSLLVGIGNESANQQKEALEKYFEYWKGDFEQIDDVCIIGIKI